MIHETRKNCSMKLFVNERHGFTERVLSGYGIFYISLQGVVNPYEPDFGRPENYFFSNYRNEPK